MTHLKRGILPLICCVLMALHCGLLDSHSTSGEIAGNGSSVGPGTVQGMLFEPGGKIPAKDALVVVRYKSTIVQFNTGGSGNTSGTLYTTLTGANGAFSFDTLDGGLYVIEGSDGRGNMVLFDSVLVDSSTKPLLLPPDTLEPAGAIRGTVSLPNGGNPLQVFVLAFGVDRFSQVSSDGTFLFKGFARGIYNVKIISLDPAYGSVDTSGIVVTSGDTTNVGQIELPVQKLPAPVLKVEYDTMLMTAKLSWHPLPAFLAKGYVVYWVSGTTRMCDDSAECQKYLVNPELLKDTMVTIEEGKGVLGLQRDSSYSFIVSMIDLSNNEGPSSNRVSVTFSSKLKAYDSVLVHLPKGMSIDRFSINKNGEFVFATRGQYGENYGHFINRYSRSGEWISSWQIPDSIDGRNLIGLLESSDTAGNCYYIMAPSRMVNPLDADSVTDSLFLYAAFPGGEPPQAVHLPKISYNDICRIIVVDHAAYLPIAPEIKRVDLSTGAVDSWKTVNTPALGPYFIMLSPAGNDEIFVATRTIPMTTSAVCCDFSGTELFSIPKETFLAASDSLIVYSGGIFKVFPSGEIREARIENKPFITYWRMAAISSAKTIYTISGSSYETDNLWISLWRFPE